MLNTITSIQKFIDNELANKLKSDAAELHILNERDMEHRIYHHLANKIDEKNFRIFSNKTFSGLKIKRAGWGTMPDLIIRNRKNDNAIELVMELKTDKKAKSAFVERVIKEKIFQDCKKLKKMLDNEKLQIEYGVFVYMYRDVDKKHSEDKIKKILKEKLDDNKRLTAICINKYQTAKGGFLSEEEIAEFDNNFDNVYNIKVGKKKTKNRKTKNKKRSGRNSTKNPNRVAGAKQAWTLMRTRKWQNDHKDSKITQRIKNKTKRVRQ